jgi:Flp pilus assembly protein TadD
MEANSSPGAETRAASGRRLLWLWDTADKDGEGLQPFLQAQKQIASQLIIWNGDSASPALAGLDHAPWRADSRFRDFCSALLAYLFDYRREPVLPLGLLLEPRAKDSDWKAAMGRSPEHSTAPQHAGMRLMRVYWGGATAEELVRDYTGAAKSGLAALPFPGRALLCSFRRDTRPLASALATTGLFGEAEMYLEQANINGKDADALYDLALVRRELGKASLAIAGAKAALAARPEFPEAENLLGVLLMQSGEPAMARAHLEAATRSAPDFAEAWNNLGYLLLGADPDRARAALQKALALAPDFPEALNNLGILSAQQGHGAEADRLFHRVLALQPDDEQAANNLAVLYARQGRTQEAMETLSALLQRNPGAASVLLNLARLQASLGKVSEARQTLERWLARHPADTTARQLLSTIVGTK